MLLRLQLCSLPQIFQIHAVLRPIFVFGNNPLPKISINAFSASSSDIRVSVLCSTPSLILIVALRIWLRRYEQMKMLATLVLTADVSSTPTQIKALVERARQKSGLQYASEPDSGCLILSSQVEHKFVLLLWSERRRSVALELQDCSMGIA